MTMRTSASNRPSMICSMIARKFDPLPDPSTPSRNGRFIFAEWLQRASESICPAPRQNLDFCADLLQRSHFVRVKAVLGVIAALGIDLRAHLPPQIINPFFTNNDHII